MHAPLNALRSLAYIAPVVKARSPHIGVNRSAIKYEVEHLFYWYVLVQDGKVIPPHVHCCGFAMYANHIVAVFDNREVWVEDPDRATWWEPRQTGEEAGFPYYDTHVVVMKKNDRPIWIPVTKEEVIARKLANLQKAMAELPPEAEARAHKMARENPNFYDKSLPPTAIQVMVLVFRHIQYPPRIWHSKVVDKLRDEMDYAALAAMIAGM